MSAFSLNRLALACLGSSCLLLSACGTDTAAVSGTLAVGDTAADGSANLANDAGTAQDSDGSADNSSGSADDVAVDAGQADTGPEDTGPFVEAKHTNPPKIGYNGAGLLIQPSIVTVTFPGEKNLNALVQFGATIGQSDYWKSVTSEYCEVPGSGLCIGPAVDGGHVELKNPPAKSYTDSTDGSPSSIQDFIAGEIDNADLPAPVTDTLYILYFPKSTTISLASGQGAPSVSCVAFGGYHHFLTYKGQQVAYAIIPECGSHGGGVSAFDSQTVAASHEIIEAATDPFMAASGMDLQAGVVLMPQSTVQLMWYMFLQGGEVGDLCVDMTGQGVDLTSMGSYTVQRSWSDAAAQSGHDPCQPSPEGSIYFNASPDKGKGYGVLDVGQTTTFSVTAFSDAPLPDGWTLRAGDIADIAQGMGMKSHMSMQVNGQDQVTVHNGDQVDVTVTMDVDPGKSQPGAFGVLLSTAPDGKTYHFWPLWFFTKAEQKMGL